MFFFFRIVLATLSPLHFYMSFLVSLSITIDPFAALALVVQAGRAVTVAEEGATHRGLLPSAELWHSSLASVKN